MTEDEIYELGKSNMIRASQIATRIFMEVCEKYSFKEDEMPLLDASAARINQDRATCGPLEASEPKIKEGVNFNALNAKGKRDFIRRHQEVVERISASILLLYAEQNNLDDEVVGLIIRENLKVHTIDYLGLDKRTSD